MNQLHLLQSILISFLLLNIWSFCLIVGRPNPRIMTTRKKKRVTKSKDVRYSSKSFVGRQVFGSSFDFDFVEVSYNDAVMIFQIYFLQVWFT